MTTPPSTASQRDDFCIPVSITSGSLVRFAGSGAAGSVDVAVTSAPHLSQKLESDRSSSPHFLQNIVTFPLPVYANSEYNKSTLYQQKRQAAQVQKHPRDPNPDAVEPAKG